MLIDPDLSILCLLKLFFIVKTRLQIFNVIIKILTGSLKFSNCLLATFATCRYTAQTNATNRKMPCFSAVM